MYGLSREVLAVLLLGGVVTTNVKKSAEVEVAFSRVGYGEGLNNL